MKRAKLARARLAFETCLKIMKIAAVMPFQATLFEGLEMQPSGAAELGWLFF